MTSDTELYQRARGLLVAETRLFGTSAERARTFERTGLLASINPHAPDRSMFNWVVARSWQALVDGYAAVAREYAEAGVRAWSVWLEPGDERGERWLSERGHQLDGRPRAMAADLSALALVRAGDLDWRETRELSVAAAINDAAYGFPPPAFAAAMTRFGEPGWRAYVARCGDRDVSSVLTFEAPDGNCGVTGVATIPEARGNAIAARLLSVALAAASARGAQTTSLQASRQGAPTYARLGYRDLGAMSMWEHRVPPPSRD